MGFKDLVQRDIKVELSLNHADLVKTIYFKQQKMDKFTLFLLNRHSTGIYSGRISMELQLNLQGKLGKPPSEIWRFCSESDEHASEFHM